MSSWAEREFSRFLLSQKDKLRLHRLLGRLEVGNSQPGDVKRLSSAPCELYEIRFAASDVNLRFLYVALPDPPIGLVWTVVMVRRKQSQRLPAHDFRTACDRAKSLGPHDEDTVTVLYMLYRIDGGRAMDFKNALGIDFNDAKTGAALEDIEEYEMLISQLVKVRRERKLTQQQVADALETTQPVISELERLAGNPSISRLMEYARAVGQRLYLYTSEVTNVAVARDLDYIAKPDIYTLEIDAVTKQSENDQQRNRPASDAYSPSTSYAATV